MRQAEYRAAIAKRDEEIKTLNATMADILRAVQKVYGADGLAKVMDKFADPYGKRKDERE